MGLCQSTPVENLENTGPSPSAEPQVMQSSVEQIVNTEGMPSVDMDTPLCVVLFGATGDLAKKKLFPAVYQLMFGAPDAPKIPQHTFVVGYGRSEQDLSKFLEKQCVNVKGEHKEKFLKQCSYVAGAYDKEESFAKLHEHLSKLEKGGKANRIYFFSVPSTVFAAVANGIQKQALAPAGGFTRLILEKPFGRDSASFAELNAVTSSLFKENELFRIDHYLGKEVVLNLVALRFGNQFFEALWNKDNIKHVQLVFKEDLGTGGRGGYFDGFGIIRDIMQNHLLQVLLWFAIEPPSSLSREAIQAEKCKLLKSIKTLSMDDCFLGQFTSNSWTDADGTEHKEPGYLDDETVPAGSKCPTYAAVALNIDNDRWRGVPFVMRAGKGLDERMAEVRVTFKEKPFNILVPGNANELVMRIQPDEAIYLKVMNKVPGWEQSKAAPVVLDMSYSKSFRGVYVADAYERMFLNTAKGDGSLFVGSDELTEAWRIFTPLLHHIDEKKPEPVKYKFGMRVPPGMTDFSTKYGITMEENFEERLSHLGQLEQLEAVFAKLDADGDKTVDIQELKEFAKEAYDGREPTDAQMKKIMKRLDKNHDGKLDIEEFKWAVLHLPQLFANHESSDHSTFKGSSH
eukprot:TRINITY_DN106844_c0_g1_i1.p1 TRINITY_DN106844_c0_g1~~TRINITY_DN106844_c0_g1_i1.p1  ORF type:complete len:626 (+),score=141.04 TRINITY_DN106844_c0_g1_i1:108-1985(+)